MTIENELSGMRRRQLICQLGRGGFRFASGEIAAEDLVHCHERGCHARGGLEEPAS
jgi:hypothetical protein